MAIPDNGAQLYRTPYVLSTIGYHSNSRACRRIVFNVVSLWCVSAGAPHWTDHQREERVYVAMPAGKELVLRCPAAAAPSPNVTWMKDGRPFEKRLVGQVVDSPPFSLFSHHNVVCNWA